MQQAIVTYGARVQEETHFKGKSRKINLLIRIMVTDCWRLWHSGVFNWVQWRGL